MSTLEIFKDNLQKESNFISDPLNYIYNFIESITLKELVIYKKLILEHNKKIIQEKREKINSFEKIITIKDNQEKPQETKIIAEVEEISTLQRKQRDYEELISKMLADKVVINQTIPKLDEQSIKEIKLAIHRKILFLEKEIQESIIENPSRNILPLQQRFLKMKTLLNQMIRETKPKEEENIITESTTKSEIKVLFLPNGKGNTFLAEDILNYLEKSEVILNAFEKIANGYFLKSKDIKELKGTKEKLYEYTNPNGIRILFLVMKENTYVICGMFYKNKNKSTKITEYYEEAIRRFKTQEDYIEKNLNNPNFYIEQAELLGELYTILERKTPVLKEVL